MLTKNRAQPPAHPSLGGISLALGIDALPLEDFVRELNHRKTQRV